MASPTKPQCPLLQIKQSFFVVTTHHKTAWAKSQNRENIQIPGGGVTFEQDMKWTIHIMNMEGKNLSTT
jgi:hypothetical protein